MKNKLIVKAIKLLEMYKLWVVLDKPFSTQEIQINQLNVVNEILQKLRFDNYSDLESFFKRCRINYAKTFLEEIINSITSDDEQRMQRLMDKFFLNKNSEKTTKNIACGLGDGDVIFSPYGQPPEELKPYDVIPDDAIPVTQEQAEALSVLSAMLSSSRRPSPSERHDEAQASSSHSFFPPVNTNVAQASSSSSADQTLRLPSWRTATDDAAGHMRRIVSLLEKQIVKIKNNEKSGLFNFRKKLLKDQSNQVKMQLIQELESGMQSIKKKYKTESIPSISNLDSYYMLMYKVKVSKVILHIETVLQKMKNKLEQSFEGIVWCDTDVGSDLHDKIEKIIDSNDFQAHFRQACELMRVVDADSLADRQSQQLRSL